MALLGARRPLSVATHAAPAWVTLADRLDREVASRQEPKLVAHDRSRVAEIVDAMLGQTASSTARDASGWKLWHRPAEAVVVPASAGSETGVSSDDLHQSEVSCNLVAHFFVARFFDGTHIQIRAHMLDRESEDIAHSHSASFFSYGVSGSYRHELIRKISLAKDDGSSSYFETSRQTSSLQGSKFGPSAKFPGRLELDADQTHEHAEGDLYFMDAADIYHKVCVRSEHLADEAPRPLTLVVRGKRSTFSNAHFVTEEPLAEEVRSHSVKNAEESEEKLLFAQLLDQMASAADRRKIGTFRVFTPRSSRIKQEQESTAKGEDEAQVLPKRHANPLLVCASRLISRLPPNKTLLAIAALPHVDAAGSDRIGLALSDPYLSHATALPQPGVYSGLEAALDEAARGGCLTNSVGGIVLVRPVQQDSTPYGGDADTLLPALVARLSAEVESSATVCGLPAAIWPEPGQPPLFVGQVVEEARTNPLWERVGLDEQQYNYGDNDDDNGASPPAMLRAEELTSEVHAAIGLQHLLDELCGG